MINSKYTFISYQITTILEYWSGSNVIFISNAMIEAVILILDRHNDSLFCLHSLYSTIEKRVI